MALIHRIRPRYKTKAEETVAALLQGSGIGTNEEMRDFVKRKATKIALAMSILYGGDYRVQIDEEDGLIVIARRRTPRRNP